MEEFFKTHFQTSGSKLKKYFDKNYLKRSFIEKSLVTLPINFVNDGLIHPIYVGPEIDIIAENEYFLVMNKPENIFVHPLVYDEQNNCLSFLRSTRPEILKVNSKNYDRGLLYRLDFETSGVLIYVKKDEDYQSLRENFKIVAKKKTYLCLVEGDCQLSGIFTHYFSSKEEKGKRVSVSDKLGIGDSGEFVLIPKNYDPLTNVTLMEVELKTGHRHQIRAQLAHLGFPLRGDVFYGGAPARRLYLHALNYQIIFMDQLYSYSIEPKDFNGL